MCWIRLRKEVDSVKSQLHELVVSMELKNQWTQSNQVRDLER